MIMLNKVIKVLMVIILIVVLIKLCFMVYADYIAINAASDYLHHIENAINK